MPRQARLDSPGTLHHVIIQGIEHSPIVGEVKDLKEFVERMGNLARETGTKVGKVCRLNDHAKLTAVNSMKTSHTPRLAKKRATSPVDLCRVAP